MCAKLLAAVTIILITDFVFLGASLLLANLVQTGEYSNKLFIMINLTMLLIQLIFLAVGMFVSVFFQRIKSVLPISLGFVFGFYMIGAILSTGKNDEALRFLSPFQYFKVTYIIEHSSYEIPYLILSAAIILRCIVASYVIYVRKDIHAV